MLPMIRYVYVALGILSCALGVIGIFVPLLPTTPFLLLSAALLFHSSPRLYNRLLNHPQLGPYIRNFREHKAIPLRVKIISVSLVWITILHAVIFLLDHWVLESLLLLLAASPLVGGRHHGLYPAFQDASVIFNGNFSYGCKSINIWKEYSLLCFHI